MVKYSFSIFLVLFIVATSCKEVAQETQNSVTKKEALEDSTATYSATSQNSLDWDGTYFGQLPCANCASIETTLKLHSDLSYQLITKHVKNENSTLDSIHGNFKWIDGKVVQLEGITNGHQASMYKVEENRLRQLDLEGNLIEGDLAEKYILIKQ
ncbi:MAG: copper resistance protein NlpE [Flavobacteriaceae bacterium]|nr:copper resistance protein NlpE [Flavobacteriaceae bacterium]